MTHPWTIFIDAQAVLISFGAILVMVVVVLAILGHRRQAKEKPQDGG